MKTLTRIVLSCLLLCAVGCDVVTASPVDATPTADGIGTSPSETETISAPDYAGVPVLAPLVAFLLTKEGIALLALGVGWVTRRFVKNKTRAQKIAGWAEQAFAAAEMMGLYKKLDGEGKYKAMIEMVIDALKADSGNPKAELTAKEVAELTQLAKRKAWIGKPTPAKN